MHEHMYVCICACARAHAPTSAQAQHGGEERHVKDREAMGRWVGEYFDDAGYMGWIYYPELFKAMLMTAFPPMEVCVHVHVHGCVHV